MAETAPQKIESQFSRILVVDDDASIRELLRVHLTKVGYEVILAVDGGDALSLAASSTPDLILIDALMPNIDGYEATNRLKRDDLTSSIPILMVSALGAPTDRARALDIGVDDFLNKPYDRMELLARVRSLLRVKRLHDSLAETNEELQKAYEAARDAETRYHSLVNDAIDAVFVVNGVTGRIVECNPAATELSGLDATTLVQYCIGDLIDGLPDVIDEPGKCFTSIDARLSGANGAAIPVSVRCSQVKSILGKLNQYTVRDLSLQRDMQSERLEVERLKAIVLTSLAVNDEVNNPLSVILGNAEYVLNNLGTSDTKMLNRLDNILDAVRRIHEVMTKLTQVVRPVTKEFLPGTEMLDLDGSVGADGE